MLNAAHGEEPPDTPPYLKSGRASLMAGRSLEARNNGDIVIRANVSTAQIEKIWLG